MSPIIPAGVPAYPMTHLRACTLVGAILGTVGMAVAQTPPNDDCATAVAQPLPMGGSLTFTGDNTGATATGDFVPGSALDGIGPCVWHKFSTSGCADVVVSYCGTTPAFAGVAAFLSPSCPAGSDYIQFFSYNYTECGNGNGTVYYVALPAGTYYLPVLLNENAPAVGSYNIVVSAESCAPPPSNDDCMNAIAVVPGPWCDLATYTSDGGTQSEPAVDCNGTTGFSNDDVWFSFEATASTMAIGVMGTDDGDGSNSTGFNAVVQLYSGTCGSLVELECADETYSNELEEIVATGLTVGQSYLVRVYDWAPGYPAVPTFGICVVEGPGIGIGIPERTGGPAWSVYPNPSAGRFGLRYDGAGGPARIELVDLTGRVVFGVARTLTTGAVLELDPGDVGAGTYLLRVTEGARRSEQRLVLQ